MNQVQKDMLVIHEALRRERTAASALKHWSAEYAANPTDWNGKMMHASWVALRAAVDALVAIPVVEFDSVSLAETPGS